MNKFYIYTVQSEDPETRSCVYVDERTVDKFAQFQFDPATMEYSGVMVEADTPHAAHEIYNSFQGGEILSADEPKVTVLKRRAYEGRKQLASNAISSLQDAISKAEANAFRLALHTYAKGCTMNVLEINRRISRMAEILRQSSKDDPDITPEEIYVRLKKRYIEQLESLMFNDPRSGNGGPDEWPGGGPTTPGLLS